MMLNDIFARARERMGGKAERELLYRYPDSRLWTAYIAELVPLLCRKCDFGPLATSADLSFEAGTSVATLKAGDLDLLGVYLVGSDGSLTEIAIESRASIAAKNRDLTETGTPRSCYLTGDGKGTMELGLWPTPDTTVTVKVVGQGMAFSELVFDELTGKWMDTGTPPAEAFTAAGVFVKRYASYLPDLFLPAAADFLALSIANSMEEYIARPALLQRYELKWRESLLQCAGNWHMTLPNIVLEQRGHVRRVHH